MKPNKPTKQPSTQEPRPEYKILYEVLLWLGLGLYKSYSYSIK